jgi:chromosome segregation ATPase
MTNPAIPDRDPQTGAVRRRKRPITVTVSGERGSGKTTLIAVVANALENSGHRVVKDRFVPAASRAVADLHEQFDITFVEQYEPESVSDQLVHEAATLRATIEELRGQVAGLSGERSRLAEDNRRLIAQDEKLREQVQQGALYAANLLAEIETLREANVDYAGDNGDLRVENADLHARLKHSGPSRARVTPQEARRQIDMAFEEVRQAAYVEMERNRLRTHADDLKQQARKLGQEGEARLAKARDRMLFALTGGTASQFSADEGETYVTAEEAKAYFSERVANPFSPDAKRRALTLLEQAAEIEAGSREQVATDKLLEANRRAMRDDDVFPQDTGC